MFLNRIACLLDKHTARTSKMHWDGDAFASECRHCGQPLRRGFGNKWKVVDQSEGDAAEATPPAPRSSD